MKHKKDEIANLIFSIEYQSIVYFTFSFLAEGYRTVKQFSVYHQRSAAAAVQIGSVVASIPFKDVGKAGEVDAE